jgi:hypothetical protein
MKLRGAWPMIAQFSGQVGIVRGDIISFGAFIENDSLV